MSMLASMRWFALIFLLVAPSFAAAQKFDDKVKLKDIAPVYVELMDNAYGGCWTNLMEAKNYAAGQVYTGGGKVVETRQEAYSVFSINVMAERMDNGMCFGSVIVSFYRVINFKGVKTLAMYSQYTQAGVQTNFNNLTLDIIKEAVLEWKE